MTTFSENCHEFFTGIVEETHFLSQKLYSGLCYFRIPASIADQGLERSKFKVGKAF